MEWINLEFLKYEEKLSIAGTKLFPIWRFQRLWDCQSENFITSLQVQLRNNTQCIYIETSIETYDELFIQNTLKMNHY